MLEKCCSIDNFREFQVIIQTVIGGVKIPCINCKGTGVIATVWYKLSSALCNIDSLLFNMLVIRVQNFKYDKRNELPVSM